MKWIEYTMKNGLQAKVAITNTVADTVASLQDEMLDPTSYTIVDDGIKSMPSETEFLQAQIHKDSIKIQALIDELATTNDVLQELILATMKG